MNLRWPRKLCVKCGGGRGERGEREKQAGFGRRTVGEVTRRSGREGGGWGGGWGGNKGKGEGEVQRPRRLHFRSRMSFDARWSLRRNLPNKLFPFPRMNISSIRKTTLSIVIIAIRKSDVTLLVGGYNANHKEMRDCSPRLRHYNIDYYSDFPWCYHPLSIRIRVLLSEIFERAIHIIKWRISKRKWDGEYLQYHSRAINSCNSYFT